MNKATLIFTSFSIFLTLSLFICLFCTDPSKPDFGNAPQIGNNDTIVAIGNEKIGSSFLMYVSAVGTAPLTFEWYKNDTLIKSSDRDSIAIDSLPFDTLSGSDRGNYFCIVIYHQCI